MYKIGSNIHYDQILTSRIMPGVFLQYFFKNTMLACHMKGKSFVAKKTGFSLVPASQNFTFVTRFLLIETIAWVIRPWGDQICEVLFLVETPTVMVLQLQQVFKVQSFTTEETFCRTNWRGTNSQSGLGSGFVDRCAFIRFCFRFLLLIFYNKNVLLKLWMIIHNESEFYC